MQDPRSPHLLDDAIRAQSLSKYRRRAASYDRSCGPTWPIRERAVTGLQLRSGQSVLDVGCGTGLSLALLRSRVGEGGTVYGFDQSPQMLALAQQRVAATGWRNVKLFETAAQSLRLPEPVDALLLHYTHDILRSPAAIERLLDAARPGATVAIAGIKYFPRWLAPLNLWVYLKNRGYNGAPGQLTAPWDRIAPRLSDWQRVDTQFGMGYLAFGRVHARRPDPADAPDTAAVTSTTAACGGVAAIALGSAAAR
jgi:demethylmenaquinone methyltransferase/2-methoxy-6-polyprenyl-1,4-benzoquinol methylase